MAVRVLLRRDTADNWAAANPVLASGELGYDETSNTLRVGDGATPWTSLQTTLGAQGPTGTITPEAEAALAAGIAAKDAAEAARDQTQQLSATTMALQQTAVAAVVTGSGPGKVALDDAYVYTVAGLGKGNDRALIDAALARTGSTVIIIPSGFTINIESNGSGFVVPAGKTLRVMPGTTLIRTALTGHLVTLNVGSRLDGGGVIDANGMATYAVRMNGNDTSVQGMTIKNSQYGIGGSLSANPSVLDNVFINNTSYAALFENTSSNVVISRNRVFGSQGFILKGTIGSGNVSNNHITITTNTGAGVGIECLGALVQDVVIANNIIKGTPTIGISVASGFKCVVNGNSVTGHRLIGIEIAEGGYNVVVSSNVINESSENVANPGSGLGINVTTSNQTTKPLRDVTVVNNIITGQLRYGIATEYGFGLIISGNKIIDTQQFSLFMNNNPRRCQVTDNVIVSTDAVTSTTRSAIRVTGTDHQIERNTVDNAQRTSVCGGISIEGGSGHTVRGNLVYKAGTGIAVNNHGLGLFDGNRVIDSTVYAINFFNSGSATSLMLSLFHRMASGTAVQNTAGATITGPSIAL